MSTHNIRFCQVRIFYLIPSLFGTMKYMYTMLNIQGSCELSNSLSAGWHCFISIFILRID